MYLRAAHVETSVPVLRRLVQDYPLGILTTAIQSPAHPLIQSSHIPFILDLNDSSDEYELGILRGHLARANPQAKAMIDSLSISSSPAEPLSKPDSVGVLDQEVQILFQSPVHHYITPKFYTHTKPSTGKVVPTWNYAAVQVYGRATIYHDVNSDECTRFLAKQIDDLSQYAETTIMDHSSTEGKPEAWKVADAPESYIRTKMKGIVGIEIRIERLEGKFKMSQELGAEDRMGVVGGLDGLESEVAGGVARLVEERG